MDGKERRKIETNLNENDLLKKWMVGERVEWLVGGVVGWLVGRVID